MEALLNIFHELDSQKEAAHLFRSTHERNGWSSKNRLLAPIFLTNDLRIADAHEATGKTLRALKDMGFDTASLSTGYGRALDFVFDAYIGALEAINAPLNRILDRT